MATQQPQQQEQPFEQQKQTPESQTQAWEGIAAEAYSYDTRTGADSKSDNDNSNSKTPSSDSKKMTENDVTELTFNDPFAAENVSFYSRSSAGQSPESSRGTGGFDGGRPPRSGDSSRRGSSEQRVIDAIAQQTNNPAQSWADTVASYLQSEGTNTDSPKRLAEAVENSRSVAEFAQKNGGLSHIDWTGLPGSQPAYTVMGKGDQAVMLAPLNQNQIAIDNGKSLSILNMQGGRAVSALEFPAGGEPTVRNLNPNESVPGMPSLSSFRTTAHELENLARIHAEYSDPTLGKPGKKENQGVQEAINPISARLMHASDELRRMEKAPWAQLKLQKSK